MADQTPHADLAASAALLRLAGKEARKRGDYDRATRFQMAEYDHDTGECTEVAGKCDSVWVARQVFAEYGLPVPDTSKVWVLVDDFGDGIPTIGPFDSVEDANNYDRHDDRLEPRQMDRAEATAALAEARRRAADSEPSSAATVPPTEACSCPSTTVIRIHGKGTYCGDMQHGRLADALAELMAPADVEEAASDVLDALRKEPAPVPDDITLLNQAQASIFRALCAAQTMNPNAGNTPVSAYVRDALRLDGLLAVPAPVVDREGLIDFLVDLYLTRLDVDSAPQGWPRLTAEALISAGLVRTGGPAQQPAAEPEPCVITDVAGDTVRVASLLGPFRIAVDTTDTTWLTPDQADQLADALKAHAAARRANPRPGGGETQ